MAQAAGATTIVQSSGNSGASVAIGYYAPYAPYGLTPALYTVAWTQTSNYTNVDLFANLFTVGSRGTVDYTLVTGIGPGTSFASNGILRGSVATPTNPADVDLFHLDSLAPGTYYLVLDSPTANTAWQYNYPFQSSLTMDTGVTYLGSQWSAGSAINALYMAGSTFSGISYPVEFRVSGTTATPEPTTFALTGMLLVGLSPSGARRRKSRN
jgi:hypothetical protein